MCTVPKHKPHTRPRFACVDSQPSSPTTAARQHTAESCTPPPDPRDPAASRPVSATTDARAGRCSALLRAAYLEQLVSLLALVDGVAVVHRARAEDLSAAEGRVHLPWRNARRLFSATHRGAGLALRCTAHPQHTRKRTCAPTTQDAGPATAAAGPHWRAAERARSRGTAARPPSAQRARRHADPVSAAPSRPAHPPTTRERPRGPAPRWLRTAVAAAATPEAARPARVRPALLRSPVLCVSQARGAHHCRRPDALLRACGAGRVRARGRRCRGAPSRSAGRHRRSCRPRGSLPCTCARACRTAWSSDAASRTWRLSQLAGSISGANCSWGCRSSSFSTHGSFDKRGAR